MLEAPRICDGPRWHLSPLLEPLKERYPYQFSKPPEEDVQQSMLTGWLPEFERLCADVDTLLAGQPCGFYWITLKEKFGSARWRPCFSHKLDAETRERLYQLVNDAQARTQRICGACGIEVASPFESPNVPLCPKHIEQSRLRPDYFWDEIQPR
jgi:hypothetical protein